MRKVFIPVSVAAMLKEHKAEPDELRELLGSEYHDFNLVMADPEILFYIGGRLPDEYTGSESRIALKKAEAKAKANVAQGIPELIETAINPIWEENRKLKHEKDAKYGWYRYDVRFAIPVYNDAGELERYNIFAARLLVNHSANGKKYLYDILNIKKETSRPQHDV